MPNGLVEPLDTNKSDFPEKLNKQIYGDSQRYTAFLNPTTGILQLYQVPQYCTGTRIDEANSLRQRFPNNTQGVAFYITQLLSHIIIITY